MLSPADTESLFRHFSANGWRRREPGEAVASEAPQRFERLVLRVLAEDMVSTAKAAELLGMRLGEFRQRLALEAPGAAAGT